MCLNTGVRLMFSFNLRIANPRSGTRGTCLDVEKNTHDEPVLV